MDNNQADHPEPQHVQKNTTVQAWEKFQAQVAAGPLPGAIAKLKASYLARRREILLGLAIFALVLATVLGLSFGGTLARMFQPAPIGVPDLPSLTPTQAPEVVTSFDSLTEQVRGFNGILPEPAPPAVDHDITLDQPRR